MASGLRVPNLKFYVGELALRAMMIQARMYISKGQRQVPTTILQNMCQQPIQALRQEGVGLHYHYGTLGQLQHGINYANAYLSSLGKVESDSRKLNKWPYPQGGIVKLFIMAGHRNMEGERAFKDDLKRIKDKKLLLDNNLDVAYKYSLGGDYKVSKEWEPLGLVDYYSSFGPELSFGSFLDKKDIGDFAIAKFTHSGSQIIDWTPEGSTIS